MSTPTQQDKEDLRFAVREQLVAVASVAFTADTIRRRVIKGRMLNYEPSLDEVAAALIFLASLGHATETAAPLGATRYYQATATGILAHERGA